VADPRMKQLAYDALALSLTGPIDLLGANQPSRSILGEGAVSRNLNRSPILDNLQGQASMTAYEPTTRERLAAGAQTGLEFLGMRRPQARSVSQGIFGGPSSPIPVNLGVADIVPFLGTALQAEEAVGSLERAGQLAQQGEMGQAAVETGMGILGLVPGVAGTMQAVRPLARQARVTPAKAEEAAKENPIEAAYFDRLRNDFESLKQEYSALPSTNNGQILNTDNARELSPEYRADRTKSADVHEPSSALVKQIYSERLAQDTPMGKEGVVLFTAGGTGAGKTTALDAASKVNKKIQNSEIIYDTNMNTFASSDQKIKQALDSGRDVQIMYTYRDPVEALENGALKRASRMEAELGTGRTVPINEHLKTHIGARKTMEELQKKYGDDPRFNLMVIDNSRGPGKAKVISGLDKLPKLDENKVRRSLDDALENAFKSGKISRAIYEGTRSQSRRPSNGE